MKTNDKFKLYKNRYITKCKIKEFNFFVTLSKIKHFKCLEKCRRELTVTFVF